MAKLVMQDIADLRAYEREREQFRTHVIALKKRRRVHVGPVVTFVFENRDTVRFQIQEMARVEKLLSDAAIQTELDVYNPLIPEPGELAATLFIELTSPDALEDWLPRLVGIEHAPSLRIGEGDDAVAVRCTVDADHEAQLTRDAITASVHYVHWHLTPDQVDAFAVGPVTLVVDHPAYPHEERLGEATVTELLQDLRGA